MMVMIKTWKTIFELLASDLKKKQKKTTMIKHRRNK